MERLVAQHAPGSSAFPATGGRTLSGKPAAEAIAQQGTTSDDKTQQYILYGLIALVIYFLYTAATGEGAEEHVPGF